MKTNVLKILGLLAFLLLVGGTSAYAQPDSSKAATPADSSKQVNDTLGSALLNEFSKDFDVTFKTVKASLESVGYVVSYSSRKYKRIETDFRQLANADNFDDVMDLYGDVPYMRSPGWSVGRAKLFITFEQIDSTRTGVKVLAQLSGYEERFTNAWHYWRSNGKLEEEAMNAIVQAMDAIKQQ